MARNITRVHISVKHTSSTDLVDSSQQFADALMRVDTFGHTFEAVPEDELDDGAVDVGRIEHGRERMAALMRRMRHAEVPHHRVEDGSSKRVVAVPTAICSAADVEPWRLHGHLVPRQNLARYRDKSTSTRIRLAVPDHDDAPPQFDISLADMTVLADSASRVDEHEHVACLGNLTDTAPELIALSDGKRLFLVQLLRPIDVEVARVVFDDEVVPQGILVELLKQGADFLLRRVSAAGMTHVIDDLVKVTESNVHENHRMEAGAMPIRISVADACGFASETREVLSFPQCIDFCKCRLARAQQGRVAIVLDEVRHRILEGLEVPKSFLSVLDSLLDDIRPPPVALQAVDGSKSVW